MSLRQELEERVEGFLGGLQSDVRDELLQAFDALVSSGIEKDALEVGSQSPMFSLCDLDENEFSLEQTLKDGPVVISFFRGAWCPFCDLELMAWQRSLQEIHRFGAKLVAISPQLAEGVKEIAKENELEYSILIDRNNAVAKKFGLVFRLTEAMQSLYERFDLSLPKFNGDESWTLPIPATYVVSSDGKISFAHVDPNYLRRAEPADILKALQKKAA